MTARTSRVGAGVLLAVAGGLALAGGTTAPWVLEEVTREVGGVAVTEVESTTGLDLAPQGLPVGLASAAGGLALLAVRGRAQRVAGAALLVAGLAGLAFALSGLARGPDGGAGGGAVAAVGGAVAVAAAGLLVLRPAPPPRLPERFDLETAPGDEEWRLAEGGERAGETEGEGGLAEGGERDGGSDAGGEGVDGAQR